MKFLALLVCVAGSLLGQDREGGFIIRFEPAVVLQANAEIPFQIRVTDDLQKPLRNAQVTLQIETTQHTQVKVYKASETDPGVYVAKPVFPSAGQWSVYVEVHRGNARSARTIDYSVPESAPPR